jgi:hypothetical protein
MAGRTNRRAADLETAILGALDRPQSPRELWLRLGVPFGGSKASRAVFDALLTRGDVRRFGVRRTFETGTEPLFLRHTNRNFS